MTDHPITPPPELVKQWRSEPEYATPGRVTLLTISEQRLLQLLARSAEWSADEELEACTAWLRRASYGHAPDLASNLRAARRPKPPSLKEQALEALDDFSKMSETLYSSYDPPEEIYSDQVNIIRRALEALPDA